MGMVEVRIFGLGTMENGAGNVLFLQEPETEYFLVIPIGEHEALSIRLAIQKIPLIVLKRPNAHDLTKSIMEALGATLKSIAICDVSDGGTIKAILEFAGHDIDARPSDAVALAVRCGVPIFVDEQILEVWGLVCVQTPSGLDFVTPEGRSKPRETKLEHLKRQLERAVEREEYEKAGKLRRQIEALINKH